MGCWWVVGGLLAPFCTSSPFTSTPCIFNTSHHTSLTPHHTTTLHTQVALKPIYVGVGPISTSDVQLAIGSSALMVGFNTRVATGAVETEAKGAGIEVCWWGCTCVWEGGLYGQCIPQLHLPFPSQILTHRVIYHLLEDIAQRAAGLAPMLQQEVVLGTANVLQVFELRKSRRSEVAMVVAGCKVADGSIRAGGDVRYRVLRSGDVIHEGRYVYCCAGCGFA